MAVVKTHRARNRHMKRSFRKDWKRCWQIYLMLLPVVLYYIIFHYIPMGGIVIAFQEFKPALGIFRSEWVGFEQFIRFFSSPYAWRLIRNTILLSVYQIIFTFPMPIILALLLNEMRDGFVKRACQTVTYMPHFISLVVICGIVRTFTGSTGIITTLLSYFGMEPVNLLSQPQFYRTIYIASGIWESVGWESIIYMATLASTDVGLYEAADLDGANRFQKIWHINVPVLVPVIAIQLIMRIGRIMAEGPDKTILLYTPITYETSDIISSYVYRSGLEQFNYSSATAIGLFNALINMCLVIFANWFSRTHAGESLW